MGPGGSDARPAGTGRERQGRRGKNGTDAGSLVVSGRALVADAIPSHFASGGVGGEGKARNNNLMVFRISVLIFGSTIDKERSAKLRESSHL